MKKVIYPIFAVVVFLILQALAGVAVAVIIIVSNPGEAKEIMGSGDPNSFMNLITPEALGWAIALSGIVSVGIVALLKMIDWKNVLCFKCINWKWGVISIIASIVCIFCLGILEEIADLPNLMEDTFTDMSNSLTGALCIGLIGPIVEEFIFREAILGYMLRGGINKWVAIIASALVFGIIHLNPAQVPFAAAMGIIFGIIYYKTGNIVIPCILHILNNSVAVWQMYTLGEAAKDFSLIEWLGGQGYALGIFYPGMILSILNLFSFWKHYQPKQTKQLNN